jgi:hypothetical protein
MTETTIRLLGGHMKFQPLILATHIGQEEIEQNHEHEGEKYKEDQSHTIPGEELQVLQHYEPDMTEVFHNFILHFDF